MKEPLLAVYSNDNAYAVAVSKNSNMVDSLIALTVLVNSLTGLFEDSGMPVEAAQEIIQKAVDQGFKTYQDNIKGEKLYRRKDVKEDKE
jgi:hypothetical protein